MFVNLHTLPSGSSMYTLAVTSQPVDTPKEDVFYDEIDVVAKRFATLADVINAATMSGELDGYEGTRVIGLIDQSAGEVLFENSKSDIVLGPDA